MQCSLNLMQGLPIAHCKLSSGFVVICRVRTETRDWEVVPFVYTSSMWVNFSAEHTHATLLMTGRVTEPWTSTTDATSDQASIITCPLAQMSATDSPSLYPLFFFIKSPSTKRHPRTKEWLDIQNLKNCQVSVMTTTTQSLTKLWAWAANLLGRKIERIQRVRLVWTCHLYRNYTCCWA